MPQLETEVLLGKLGGVGALWSVSPSKDLDALELITWFESGPRNSDLQQGSAPTAEPQSSPILLHMSICAFGLTVEQRTIQA